MCRYKPPKGQKKLTPGVGASACGIQTDVAVETSCKLMLITCIPYVIIQAPAFLFAKGSLTDLHPNNTHHSGDIEHESDFALVGLVACVVLFVGCCALFVQGAGSKESQDTVEALKGEQQKLALADGLMNFTGLFQQDLLGMVNSTNANSAPSAGGGGEGMGAGLLDAASAAPAPTGGSAHDSPKHKVEKFLSKFTSNLPLLVIYASSLTDLLVILLEPIFSKYDADRSGDIDVHELTQVRACIFSSFSHHFRGHFCGHFSSLLIISVIFKRTIAGFAPPFFAISRGNNDSLALHEKMTQLFKDLGEEVSGADLRGIIAKFDADKNGEISFSEFVEIMIRYLLQLGHAICHQFAPDSGLSFFDTFYLAGEGTRRVK